MEILVSYIVPYLLGFCSAGVVLIFCLIMSGRNVKLLNSIIDDLRQQVMDITKKMMSVDYQKLAELDMQAKAVAMEYVVERGDLYQTPDMGDMDIFDLEQYKVKTGGTSDA